MTLSCSASISVCPPGLTVLFTGALTDSTQRTTYQNNGMDPLGQFILRDGGTPPWQYNLSSTYNLPFFRNSKGATARCWEAGRLSGIVSWFPGGIITVSGANSTGVDPALPTPSYNRWFNTCTINNNTGLRQNCASTSEPVAWVIQKPFTLITTPDPEWSSVRARVPAEFNLSLFKSVPDPGGFPRGIPRRRRSTRSISPRFGNPTNTGIRPANSAS